MLPAVLTDGYQAFTQGRLRREQSRFQELADSGQSPKVMLIGCCDSRVSPEVIFDARPGEVFVVRNVANLVPPYAPDGEYHGTSAALEFAVQQLRVAHIIVLGHARCGGIRAFASRNLPDQKPLSPGDFIGKWISQLETVEGAKAPAKGQSIDDYVAMLEVSSLRNQLKNLRSFPCVNILEGRGKIQLHACHFDIATGQLSVYDELSNRLMPAMPGAVPTLRPVAQAV
jgi:carbonic anhydrase